jgi:hypothetical protein
VSESKAAKGTEEAYYRATSGRIEGRNADSRPQERAVGHATQNRRSDTPESTNGPQIAPQRKVAGREEPPDFRDSLIAKLSSVGDTAIWLRLPRSLTVKCALRMADGHEEHLGQSILGLDWREELRQELADSVNYLAIARLQGNRLGLRHRVAGWFVAWAWRLVSR